MWVVLVLTSIFFLFLYRRLLLPLRYWNDRDIPHPSPTIIIGNLGPVLRRKETFNKLLQITCEQYENHRYFGFYEFSKPVLIILDRDLIKEIFVKSFDSFTDHLDFLPKDVDTFWKKGLFAREGSDWHDMRVTLSPTFTSKKMKAMFHLVAECSERFVDYFLKKNGTVTLEIMEAFCKFNNDVIASCTYGVHCDSLNNENNEFNVMATEAFDFNGLKSLKFFGNSLSPTLSRLFKVKMFSNKIRDFYVRITKEAIDYRKKTGLHRPDVIHLLMEAQKGRLTFEDDEEEITSGFAGIEDSYSRKSTKAIQITDEDIASQILVFFFGSHDTISAVLSQTVYELVANTHAQEKLIDEVDRTLSRCNGGKITYESLFQMKYLDMVVTETLRLWAPPAHLNRKCVKPFVIEPVLPNEKSFLIEPGTEVVVPIDAFHKNPKYYKNPENFDPERFSSENRKNIKPFTYFPFGVGPRHCIGNRFALMVVKLMIVNLLTHFQLIPVKKTVIPFERKKDCVVLRSAHGYWFGLKPRMGKT